MQNDQSKNGQPVSVGSTGGSASVERDLYEYLREQCPTLEAAKAWIWKWANDCGQCLPWDTEPVYTSRAMAGHLSNVLEGGNYETGYALGNLTYMDTKHGSELYWAAWGSSPNNAVGHTQLSNTHKKP